MKSPDRRSVLKTIGSGAALFAAGVGTSAAHDDDEARIRVAHASPDAPAVDVYVDAAPDGNEPAIAGAEFTDVTDYLVIPEGEHEVTITAAGSTEPVAPTPLTVGLSDNPYTFAAIGELSPENGESCFTVDVYKDDLDPLDDDTGRVRAYHAVPDAPAVDVRVEDGPTGERPRVRQRGSERRRPSRDLSGLGIPRRRRRTRPRAGRRRGPSRSAVDRLRDG